MIKYLAVAIAATSIILFPMIAKSLITEDQINLSVATGNPQSAKTFYGYNCQNLALSSNKAIKCYKVIVTGLQSPTSQLNFHFLDKNGNGINYVTQRTNLNEGGQESYQLLGWSFETSEGIEEFHEISDLDRSRCLINANIEGEKIKIFCAALSVNSEKGFMSSLR